jgi:tRNA pseudouridine55 synthase
MGMETGGIVVVDKPAGVTSAGVVAAVKRIFRVRKAGHTGTLDPFATGVLVCCLNRATRLARFFLHGDKAYQAQLFLGVETDTQDATGTVTAAAEGPLPSRIDIRQAFGRFRGRIRQMPPAYSALKHRGVPLYKLARRGAPVQKEARQVFISRLEIIEIRPPEVRFEVTCSAGTYIRTLCADIGRTLGCGGHLKELRRIESGGFAVAEAFSLQALDHLAQADRLDSALVAMSDALRHIPALKADAVLADRIRYGRKLVAADLPGTAAAARAGGGEHFIKIVDAGGDLLAVLEHNRRTGSYDYCVNLQ